MSDRWEGIKTAAIARGGGALLTALMRTTRSELIAGAEVEREYMARAPAIYILWHGRLLPCAYRYGYARMSTLISQNRDGDYITRVIERWGYTIVRGSSSRGGAAALREIVRLVRAGDSVALTPDGPRGPRQKMKMGPLRAAQLTQAPIIPVTAGAVRAAYFGSWDRFLVPAPFTWIPVAMGEPYWIDRSATEESLETDLIELETRLDALTDVVDEAARAAR